MVKKEIHYFETTGEENTDKTLKIAKRRADELGIKDILVASTRGNTGVKASTVFKGYNLVVVPHVTGYREPGAQELTEENRAKIEGAGGRVVIAAHAFSGVDIAIYRKWSTMYPTGIIAQTLRMFGQGMKVVVEITAMAMDAGAIPADKEIIVITGSHRGADTAAVVKPVNSRDLFDMEIKEIIAKPRDL
ncbi:MAG: pyruvate kinase alpha/beta domain-containing protein [Candidatus Bathyarchaeota archaeon]|jgi:hypothetical protein